MGIIVLGHNLPLNSFQLGKNALELKNFKKSAKPADRTDTEDN